MIKYLNNKNIFLFDGCGALLSAGITGLLMPQFYEWIGLSVRILYQIAMIPFFYALYSLCCYFFVKNTRPWMLAIIIFANASYCVLAGIIMMINESITYLGRIFISLEILVIIGVIAIEYRVFRRLFNH